MRKIKEFINEYQLISFFVLTYLFTWLLILPVILTGDQQLGGLLGLVGIFGPALINIFISRLLQPKQNVSYKNKKLITFMVIWIICTAAFTLNVKMTSGLESIFVIVIFAIIGLLPTLVILSAFSKFPGVRKSLSSLIKPSGHYGYYLFALLMAPTIKIISIPITKISGFGMISTPELDGGTWQITGFIIISFLYGFFYAGGINEEVGWTGFALPRLQKQFNPFITSIILWFFWILWHIPLQITGFWNPETSAFLRAILGTFFARFILTWLFNKTNGGIIAPMILHVSANVSFMVLPNTYTAMILEALLAALIIFISKMWKKLPVTHEGVYNITNVLE